jgi:hypothetical protein
MNVFPIKTATSCQLKWVWSTLLLNSGITRSCHRTAESKLTAENFSDFHNTDVKIQDRLSMLAGQWPEQNCGYCRSIEEQGGVSDRIRHLSIPYRMPQELRIDPEAVNVSPTVLEVFFDNTCNLGCLYCTPSLSSFIEAENKKHGRFEKHNIILHNQEKKFQSMIDLFWTWFPEGFPKLARMTVLGGEPFYQKEVDQLLSMIAKHPNPHCTLSFQSNLMISESRMLQIIEKLQSLTSCRLVKRVDITCSIDCWGPEQQYVRWPLDLDRWQKNFEMLIEQQDFYLNINQTISPLTIKTMPQLLERLATWRRKRHIGHWFSEVSPGPDYLKPHILGWEIFELDFTQILNMMPMDTEEDRLARQYMSGIFNRIRQHEPDPIQIRDMFVYLEEKDRRRGTDWRNVFPWLEGFRHHVV